MAPTTRGGWYVLPCASNALYGLKTSCSSWKVLHRAMSFPFSKGRTKKFVTESAYENPKFVEDIVRDVASELEQDQNVRWFLVDVENFESIHNHSAYAFIERQK